MEAFEAAKEAHPEKIGGQNAFSGNRGRYVAAAVEGTNVDPRGSAIVWEIESGRLVGSVPFSGSASVLLLGPDGGSLVLKATGEPALDDVTSW